MTCATDDRADVVRRRLDSLIDRYSPYAGPATGLALTPFVLGDAAPA